MAVKIRLKRMGKVRAPHYRIVAVDSRKKRDGRVLEELGTYNPKAEPSIIHVNSERTQYWLGVGAQPSEPVAAILKVTGDWQRFKGEPEPQPMKVAEPKRDKAEIFNEALKEAHSEPRSDAVTGKKAKKAAAEPKADDAGAEDQAKAESRPAEDQPKAEEAAAEESKAAEPAEESADAEKSEG